MAGAIRNTDYGPVLLVRKLSPLLPYYHEFAVNKWFECPLIYNGERIICNLKYAVTRIKEDNVSICSDNGKTFTMSLNSCMENVPTQDPELTLSLDSLFVYALPPAACHENATDVEIQAWNAARERTVALRDPLANVPAAAACIRDLGERAEKEGLIWDPFDSKSRPF